MDNNTQPQQPMNNNFQSNPTGDSGNGMSIAALVCGIIGIIGAFIPYVNIFCLVLAILGIVFGVKGMKKAKITGAGKGLAVAGLVLGIIGTSFSAILVLCTVILVGTLGSMAAFAFIA